MSKKSRELGITELTDFAPHHRPALEQASEGMGFLEAITRDDAAKLPEPLFVEHLLPVLTNRSGNQSLEQWQRIAGNVMRPIDVTDPRTGEVLFRVPPILRSINGEFTGTGKHSAFEIISVAKKKREVIPAMGDSHISANLTNRMPHYRAQREHVIQWNEILKRYGCEPILSIDTTPEDVKTGDQDASDDLDIDGFDDF